MSRRFWASALAAFAVLGAAMPLWAGPPMGTSLNALPDSTVASGGGLSASGTGVTNNLSTSTVGEPIAGPPAKATSNIMYPGGMNMFFFPGTVSNFAAHTDVSNSSVTFQWSTPGYDGGNAGTLQAGSSYFIAVATYVVNNLVFASPFTSGVLIATGTVGTGQGATVFGGDTVLMPNSIYYASLFTADNQGDVSYSSNQSTFTTLANPPQPLATTFQFIYYTSTTVAWAALPPAQTISSTMTSEGYEVDASSTEFGVLSPGGVIYTSVTFNNAASSLTVDGSGNAMSFGDTTYYFRVGSMNWASTLNYVNLQKLNLQISISTIGVSFGSINPQVIASTVSISSAQVVNLGNVPVTLQVVATTTTAGGSPWALAITHGIDIVELQGLWTNAVPGAGAAGWTPITNSTTTSGQSGGAYASSGLNAQTGYEIQPGSSATMWFQFTPPTSTSSIAKQTFQIQYFPIYP